MKIATFNINGIKARIDRNTTRGGRSHDDDGGERQQREDDQLKDQQQIAPQLLPRRCRSR